MVVAARISQGETAVILGATGGVGSAAVQIAKSRGATVIGGVRSKAMFASLQALGADVAIDTSAQNVADTVRQLTNGRGANVVFDTTGMMFAEAIDTAAPDGRVPVIAAPHDGKANFNLRSLYRNELRVLGVDTRNLDAIACAKLLTEMSSAFESGAFRATPAEPRPLEEAAQAYADAAHGGAKLFLQPNG
jgi:NADPH:quinone reductase-like Zn-dependent oxidoreductase